MERKLTGIPETMLIPLWAKSVESTRSDPIISDPKAVEIVSRMDYDFSRFSRSWLSQVGVAVRTRILDDAVLDFLSRNPGAVVVNLGAGLDTRYERLKNENIGCWYDLDVPEAITFRRMFFSESERNRFIAESVFNLSWLKNIESRSGPALVIAEGLLMYFSEFELKALFRSMAARLSGSEMLFEMLAPMLVGRSKYHDSVNRIGGKIEFKWGLRDSRAMEDWSPAIKWVQEWNYYEYHKERWKWFGVLGRMPFIGPRLSNRIVHLRFENRAEV